MTSTATPTKIKARDTVELLKPQWEIDPREGRKKVADVGTYEVEYVMSEPDNVKIKWGKKGFWVPLEDVKLVESYVSPKELITPVQAHVYRQLNGKPRDTWELADVLNQPGTIIRGALNALVRQGLVEEVKLDVWRKIDENDATTDSGEAGQDSSDIGEPTGDLSPCVGEPDGSGQASFEETPSSANGDRGADTLLEPAVVLGQEERPDWVVEAERELNQIQGQIDNCVVEGDATTDKELKKALLAGYKENQKLFNETLKRYVDLGAEMGYHFSYQSQPPNSTQNHLVVFIKPVEVCAEPRVVEPQSKLGEILNLAAAGEAKTKPIPTLPQLEAKANELWEQRSLLEGELLHCLGEIYLLGNWKQSHKTWTKYFVETFSHWQKAHRYRMKDAGEMFAHFLQDSPRGDFLLPTSEGQLRELKPLPAPERVETWKQVVKEHGEAPSRTVVAEIVKKRKVELEQPAQLKAQFKTEEEIAAQFNCQVGDPVRVTYTGRARGLESDVVPQYDGLIGVVQKLGVAGALVYVPILKLTMRCTPSQMVAVPLPSESRNICDRITLIMATRQELSPMMRGALEALSRQLEYSEDDLWLLEQIEERLTLPDQGQSSVD